jgi:hypothetical protein
MYLLELRSEFIDWKKQLIFCALFNLHKFMRYAVYSVYIVYSCVINGRIWLIKNELKTQTTKVLSMLLCHKTMLVAILKIGIKYFLGIFKQCCESKSIHPGFLARYSCVSRQSRICSHSTTHIHTYKHTNI